MKLSLVGPRLVFLVNGSFVRFSLRNQILLPMAGLMVFTLLAVSALHVLFAVQRTRAHIEGQLRDVTRTLVEANYPLNDAVLRQMRGLSGAELVLVDAGGETLANSGTIDVAGLPNDEPSGGWKELHLGSAILVQGDRYFHYALPLARGLQGRGPLRLHVFYPQRNYSDALWDAVLPPIVVGSVALVVLILLAHWFASRLSQPMRRLQAQVDRIARGEFVPMPLPQRDDELRDLARAVNRMSHMLAEYEDEVRRSEQLRTLGILRGGIAHQMRNAVTGCRMALDLHRRAAPTGGDEESLEVALRQLALLEKQLQKFLSQEPGAFVACEVELGRLVTGVIPLVEPAARHLGVTLDWEPPTEAFPLRGDATALEQLTVNLLLNALDAAAEGGQHGTVRIAISPANAGRVALEIYDSGRGPSEQISAKLFDPLVTDKAGGTGLGLSVAREVSQQHGGSLDWRRDGTRTCFRVELPLAEGSSPVGSQSQEAPLIEEHAGVKTAGR